MKSEIIKEKLNNNKTILENFSYITVLQMFVMLMPLITYPYLTRVLGTELYGLVITAQILASYATIVVRFGFDAVSPRHISIWRDDCSKLSEVVSTILSIRFVLWGVSFFIYIVVVFFVPVYRQHFWLFVLSYGLTLNVLLFPQFFFQGVERMKYITYINVGIQAIFVILTFIVIKNPEDYFIVPLLYTIGYILGGIVALYVIYKRYNLKFKIPTKSQVSYYFKDALPLFATDAVCTIKDKLGYLLLGIFVSMGDVIIYDIGSKLTSLAVQPVTIINTVIFPKMAKNKNNGLFIKIGFLIFATIFTLVVLINIFLDRIVYLLIGEEVSLLPIRIFLLSPIFLGLASYIGSSLIVARGYNKYMFYSILVTTIVYLLSLLILYATENLNTIMAFVGLTVVAYLVEVLYRMYVAKKLLRTL